MNECESDPIYNPLLANPECKQLSCERIDDHTPNDLNCCDRAVFKKTSLRYLMNLQGN